MLIGVPSLVAEILLEGLSVEWILTKGLALGTLLKVSYVAALINFIAEAIVALIRQALLVRWMFLSGRIYAFAKVLAEFIDLLRW